MENENWESVLTANPKMLWGLVADVVKAVKANEGERKTGRRPAVSVGSLDELYNILFPSQYTELPFRDAFAKLMVEKGFPTQQSFADAIGFNQATVSRILARNYAPDVEMFERIAHVLDVRPSYFAEYRALKIGQIVTDLFMAHPQMSADAVRRFFGANV